MPGRNRSKCAKTCLQQSNISNIFPWVTSPDSRVPPQRQGREPEGREGGKGNGEGKGRDRGRGRKMKIAHPLFSAYELHCPKEYTPLVLQIVHVHYLSLIRCLRHRAPRYLADYCVPVSEVAGRQHLRSARCHQLSVPRVSRSTFGTRIFSVTGQFIA